MLFHLPLWQKVCLTIILVILIWSGFADGSMELMFWAYHRYVEGRGNNPVAGMSLLYCSAFGVIMSIFAVRDAVAEHRAEKAASAQTDPQD